MKKLGFWLMTLSLPLMAAGNDDAPPPPPPGDAGANANTSANTGTGSSSRSSRRTGSSSNSESGSAESSGSSSERRSRYSSMMRERVESLKAQYPEEAAEIEKLMQTDQRAAMRKAAELMRKAGTSFGRDARSDSSKPRSEGQVSGSSGSTARHAVNESADYIKANYPDDWADIEMLLGSKPEEGWHRFVDCCRRHRLPVPPDAVMQDIKFNPIAERDVVRVSMERADRELKRKFPAEFAGLQKLRLENRVLAGIKFQELLDKGKISRELVVPAPMPKRDESSGAAPTPAAGVENADKTAANPDFADKNTASRGKPAGAPGVTTKTADQ